METEGLLPCLQEPAIGPYRKMNPVHTLTTYLFKIHFNSILPSMLFQVASYLQVLWPDFARLSHLSHTCYMPQPISSSSILSH
jgi:hypothetical protein